MVPAAKNLTSPIYNQTLKQRACLHKETVKKIYFIVMDIIFKRLHTAESLRSVRGYVIKHIVQYYDQYKNLEVLTVW